MRRFWISAPLMASLGFSAACSAAPAGVIEVPFTYEASSISLELRMNGERPLRMLLDTGWGPTTLDVRVARQEGWLAPGQDPSQVDGHTLAELRLGDLTVRDWPVDVADLAGINPPGIAPYDGVLGCGFLKGRVVQVDFARRVLRFLPDAPPRGPESATRTSVSIHFSALGCLPIADSVWVNGRRLSALFDTGGGVQFLVTPRAVDYLSLADSVRNMRTVTSAYFSEDSARAGVARLGRLRQVRVGSIVADTARAVFGARGEGLMDQPLEVWGLIIGNRFLEKFLVTFDFRANRVTLERPAAAAGAKAAPQR